MRLTKTWEQPSTDQDGARPGARIQSGPSHAAKGGAPPPPTIMAIATALPRLLMATASRARNDMAATQRRHCRQGQR